MQKRQTINDQLAWCAVAGVLDYRVIIIGKLGLTSRRLSQSEESEE